MENEIMKYYGIRVIILIIVLIIINYNRVIRQENKVKNMFSAIDVIFQKRYDLIPNLVSIVKQYMKYEKEVLETITTIRSQKLSNNQVIEMNEDITEKINEIYVQVENYPNLKADEVFKSLTQNLIAIENELAAARRVYNSTVTKFNTMILVFPNSVLATLMGKREYKLFEKEAEAIKPTVKME